MSANSLHFAGVVLITVPAIAFGGARLLTMIFRREPGYALVAGPILMPLGFFLSLASPRAQHPNQLIYLVPLGGASLSVGAAILGVGLLSA